MFKNYGIMPGTLAKESPFILFKMLDSLEDDDGRIETDDYLRMFYGG